MPIYLFDEINFSFKFLLDNVIEELSEELRTHPVFRAHQVVFNELWLSHLVFSLNIIAVSIYVKHDCWICQNICDILIRKFLWILGVIYTRKLCDDSINLLWLTRKSESTEKIAQSDIKIQVSKIQESAECLKDGLVLRLKRTKELTQHVFA